jgi:hypothetical protein
MRFSIVALALAASAMAAPLAFRETESVSARSGILSGVEDIFERGLLSDIFGPKTTVASGSTPATVGSLKVSFSDSTGSISAARQKSALKLLNKAVSAANQKKFPFCSVAFGSGAAATFRCFSSASKTIGSQGPAGALNVP